MRLVSWLGNLLGGGGGGLDGVEQQRSGPPGDIFYIAPVVLSTRRQTWTGTVAAVVVVQGSVGSSPTDRYLWVLEYN